LGGQVNLPKVPKSGLIALISAVENESVLHII
jgi:hypothetical protein